MKRVFTLQVLLPVSMLWLLFTASCTKFDTTTLGGDLIPVVDNVNTFDTVLQVVANNYIPDDSTRLRAGDPHPVGGILNDPMFGASRATLFFEMKPPNFPFLFANRDSIIALDSAVMILGYRGFYGDSTFPMTLRLYEVDRKMQADTLITPFYTLQPNLGVNRGRFWGEKTMEARRFRDTIVLKRDTVIFDRVTNQLRIPLNRLLAQSLFFQDTLTGAFRSDSLYKEFLPGFALEASGSPQALFYFGMTEGSKLEFYYRKRVLGGIDTTIGRFSLTPISAHAAHFDRQRNGSEVTNFLNQDPVNGSAQVYLQATPGTMASVQIPGLATLTNRLIHRAELRVTELPASGPGGGPSLAAPFGLYLDVQDSTGRYRGLPYDLSPFSPYFCFPSAGVEFSLFGGLRNTITVGGQQAARYTFNLTRYIQSVISRREPLFENLRLSAPFTMFYRDCINPNTSYPAQVFPFTVGNNFVNRVGEGRVRVAGGNHPDPQLRMQLRIIYSKVP